MNDNNSLAHSKWDCKYHIVFAPKYRRKEIYGNKKSNLINFLYVCAADHDYINISRKCEISRGFAR